MQQEAAHELVRCQGHGLVACFAVSPVVLPAERDTTCVQCQEARVRDRDPVGVAREISEDGLGSCEGALGVDDPLALTERCEPIGEDSGIGQIDVLAEELELSAPMGVLELFEEAAPEQAREHPHREEEPSLAGDPAFGIKRKTTARHDAVHMWMVGEGGAPGVQHEGHTDAGTQVLRVGGDRAQCLGSDVEEQSIAGGYGAGAGPLSRGPITWRRISVATWV